MRHRHRDRDRRHVAWDDRLTVAGGAFEPVIERGETLPAEATRAFITAIDDRSTVEIAVYRGDSGIAADSEHLGTFERGHPARSGGRSSWTASSRSRTTD